MMETQVCLFISRPDPRRDAVPPSGGLTAGLTSFYKLDVTALHNVHGIHDNVSISQSESNTIRIIP